MFTMAPHIKVVRADNTVLIVSAPALSDGPDCIEIRNGPSANRMDTLLSLVVQTEH
jgi:hypothetical protein